MPEEIDYSSLAVGLQSIDFASNDMDFETNSMPLFPFSPSWLPNNLSYAVYSLDDTKAACEKDNLNIWARFVHVDSQVFANVRATIFTPEKQSELDKKKNIKRFAGERVLGEIQSTKIWFGETGSSLVAGDSNVALLLSGAEMNALGVGVYDVFWLWEYQELVKQEDGNWITKKGDGDGDGDDDAGWTVFERSMHRVFVTLDTPQHPWTATPFRDLIQSDYSKCPIWTEALIWACDWARESQSIDEAGKKISNRLFKSKKFKYQLGTAYTSEEIPEQDKKLYLAENTTSLELSKFIERLEGGDGNGELINCVDCAFIVATLTNLLGGDLQIGTLEPSPSDDISPTEDNKFDVNPLKLIGTTIEDSESTTFFSSHTIAWRSPISGVLDINHVDNIVFDACLQFVKEKGVKKTDSPSGLLLGDDKDSSGYRFRLATKIGLEKCIPQADTRRTIRIV
ncbi:MAG: hypothetical protein ACI837_001510 [Crocinitomicaceae bacterium]|jgi:hypothetical protein